MSTDLQKHFSSNRDIIDRAKSISGKRVFLGGTIDSDWRDKFIPMLKIEHFNPVVENWTEECKKRELEERQTCDFLLYVITPGMKGVYSIAEVSDDSNKNPEKTVLVILKRDDGESFSKEEMTSLTAVKELVEKNGGQVFDNLKSAAEWINQCAEDSDMTSAVNDYSTQYAVQETLNGQIKEIGQTEDSIDSAIDETAALEALCGALDDCRSVGLESRSAEIVRLQIHDVRKRYGVGALETPFPSMESFSSPQKRLYTSVSLESVKEVLQRIWIWIKEQLEHLIALVKRFYHHLTRSLDSLSEESRIVKNLARQAKMKGGVKINLGYAARKICINGAVSKDFTSALNVLSRVNRVSEETLSRVSAEFIDKVKSSLEQNRNTIYFSTEVLIPAGFSPNRELGRFEFGADAMRVFVSPQLPGDRVIAVAVFGSENKTETYDLRRGMVYGRAQIIKMEYPEPETSVDSLSSEEVFTLCQRIDKTIASLRTSRSDIERHLTQTKSMVESVIRKYSRDNDEGKIEEALRQIIGNSWKNTLYGTKLVRLGEEVAYDVCRGYLAWARKSLDVVTPAEPRLLTG